MNEKVKDFGDSAKEFGRKAKEQAFGAVSKAGNWVVRNKELVVVTAPVLIAGIKSGQSLIVSKRVKDERKRIDNTYYDPSTGFHWDLRRKATNADRAEILKRKKLGYETGDILKQLNLLK